MRKSLIALLVALCCSCARADEPIEPYPYVSASVNGKYYFKMLPPVFDRSGSSWKEVTPGSGTLFAVSAIGQDKPLWNTSGWYALYTFVSYDGKYLVRMGDWPVGEPSKEHLAIAFYENGKLIKSYSTIDILKNPSHAPHSVSHYQYLKQTIGFRPYTYEFTIRTVEDIEYTFDVRNGNVIAEKPQSVNQSSSLGIINILLGIWYDIGSGVT